MEMIRRPLQMSEAENRAALALSEKRLRAEAPEAEERRERRLSTKRAQQDQKRELAKGRAKASSLPR